MGEADISRGFQMTLTGKVLPETLKIGHCGPKYSVNWCGSMVAEVITTLKSGLSDRHRLISASRMSVCRLLSWASSTMMHEYLVKFLSSTHSLSSAWSVMNTTWVLSENLPPCMPALYPISTPSLAPISTLTCFARVIAATLRGWVQAIIPLLPKCAS